VSFDGCSDLGPIGFGAALYPLAGQMESGQFGQVSASLPKGLLAADSVDHPPQPWAERAADHSQVFVLGETPCPQFVQG